MGPILTPTIIDAVTSAKFSVDYRLLKLIIVNFNYVWIVFNDNTTFTGVIRTDCERIAWNEIAAKHSQYIDSNVAEW